MRPVRVSSEGPEVVPDRNPRVESLDKYLVPSSFSQRFNRSSTIFQQKQSDGQVPEPEPALFTPAPPTGYNPGLFKIAPSEDDRKRNPTFGMITTILFALVGFLIGGGIAGGVGGAIAAKDQAKIHNLQSSLAASPISTTTVTAPGSVSTIVLDTAGCPLVNNTTYNSTIPGYSFLRLCATDIAAPPNTDIDVSNSQQNTFESCLDACASYNQNVRQDGCVGASWVLFSPSVPSRNSVCFLKNSTGVQTAASVSRQTVVSGLLEAVPSP